MRLQTRTTTPTESTEPTDTARQDNRPLPHAPWADTLTPALAHELTLPSRQTLPTHAVDIAVIGAGVAGLSAAIAAAAVGVRVLVLEDAPAIGHGATGRNAGILSAGINMGLADVPAGSPDVEMWPATTQALLMLAEQAKQPDALLIASLTGSLSLAERPATAHHLEREAHARVAAGLRAELWEPAQVAQATDGRLNTDSVVSALWLPDEGRINPLSLLAHLAQRARAAGAELVGGCHIAAYEETSAKAGGAYRWRVQTAAGATITARGLIAAVGPTAQPTARIYALAFAADLPDNFPLFWDAAPYTYCDFRPGEGRLGVSGGRYGRVGGSPRAANYHQRLADAARHWLPELRGANPTHAWAVDLAVAADMTPQIRHFGASAPAAAIEGLGALGILPGIVLGGRAGATIAQQIGSR